jgi:hypothetical protein
MPTPAGLAGLTPAQTDLIVEKAPVEQPTAGQVVAPAASDAATLQMLVQLLLAERQDALEERKAKAAQILAREKQRQIAAEFLIKGKIQSQELCTHKKGGKGIKGPKVDYAISFHTFSNAESYIRCLICGMKWKNKDTDEYLVRRGKQVKNHTGIGWKKAYGMLGESSNTATSSEVQLTTRPVEFAGPDFANNPDEVEI